MGSKCAQLFALVSFLCTSIGVTIHDNPKSRHEDHNNCLVQTHDRIKQKLNKYAAQVDATEMYKFDCNICLRPDGEPITYKWKRHIDDVANEELLVHDGRVFNEEKYVIPENEPFSLIMLNIQEEDAGHYWCEQYHTDTLVDEYHLTVLKYDMKIPSYENAPRDTDLHVQYPSNIIDLNLKAFIKWNGWTSCSKCGEVGFRVRVGVCYMNPLNEGNKSWPIFSLYKNGIPCKSKLLPNRLMKLESIQSLKSNIMYGDCYEACLGQDRTVIRIKGEPKQISAAQIRHIQYESDYDPKKLFKLPINLVLKRSMGDNAYIRCTNNTQFIRYNELKYWEFNGKILSPKTIAIDTNNRITIDLNTNLQIRNITERDIGIYKCYINHKLSAFVNLKIKKISDFELTHSQVIFSVGFLMAVATLLFVFLFSCISKLSSGRYY